MARAPALRMALVLLCGCSPVLGLRDGKRVPTRCDSNDECGPHQECRAERCRTMCDASSDCGSSARCEEGVCLPNDTCRSGARRCEQLTPHKCTEEGTWVPDGAPCTDGCDPGEGQCFVPRSCDAAPLCGDDASSCCQVLAVPGGVVSLRYDGQGGELGRPIERTVSPFNLERFEVSLGRFQAFLDAYSADEFPYDGAGAHPSVPESGWRAAWNDDRESLPLDRDSVMYGLTSCDPAWGSDRPDLPASCVNWYLAFAFCIWDGGRLPTEAEWSFAAMAGPEQRTYPWSASDGDRSISIDRACYRTEQRMPEQPDPVGTHPSGAGKYGHEDLAGNIWEWVADWYGSDEGAVSCGELDGPDGPSEIDCIDLQPTRFRGLKGGAYLSGPPQLVNTARFRDIPSIEEPTHGFRCVRY